MTTQWHGGKGSSRRPAQVPEETLRDNWDRIFGGSEEPDDFDEILDEVRKHLNETLFTPYDFDNEDEEVVDEKSIASNMMEECVFTPGMHIPIRSLVDSETSPTPSTPPCPPHSVQEPTKPQNKP